jgi:hypothetical protein
MYEKGFSRLSYQCITGVAREDILISRFAPYPEMHQQLRLPYKHDFYHLLIFTKGLAGRLNFVF